MKQTTNYQLPQWEETDRIMMQDFNDMTAKIDAALPRWRLYSYVGKGTYGSNNPCRLTFPERPLLVLLFGTNYAMLVPGFQDTFSASVIGGIYNRGTGFHWEGNTMIWDNYYEAGYQLNWADTTYYCLALFAPAPLEKQ